MKLGKNLEAIIVTLLFLTTLYFWTLPIQDNPLPYGEVDASSHVAVPDYTQRTDRSITDLPYYIDKRYGEDNSYQPHTLWYPPPIHTDYAIAAVLGGQPYFPIYILNAIFSSLIVLSVYFLIRKLFGFEAAILSSFLLIFSLRDIMIYLWGQWPERFGFAFLPIILYTFYRYTEAYKTNKKNPYLYIMAVLLAINLFIHPMTFFHSIAALVIASLFFLAKEKKLFFSPKQLGVAIILFLLTVSIFPSQTLNVAVKTETQQGLQVDKGDVSRLFSWFKPQTENQGVPASYFSHTAMIGPAWTILLIIAGILFLTIKRRKKDLLMLAWLVSLYIMIHLDVIGKGRVHRSLSGTAHLFYPLIILGLFFLISIIPLAKQYKSYLKIGSGILVVLLLFFTVGIQAKDALKNAYPGVSRINEHQLDLIEFLRDKNIPNEAQFYHYGSISLAKTRWLWMLSHKHVIEREKLIENLTHVIIDYSDFALMGNQQVVSQLQQLEKEQFGNQTPLYSREYIRVYPVT